MASFVALVLPTLLGIAVVSSELLEAPHLAEHHGRARDPSAGWDRFEIIAAVVMTVVVATMLVLALLDLWIHRSPF